MLNLLTLTSTLDTPLMTILESSERDLYQKLDKVSRTIFVDLLVNRVSSSFLWIKSRSKIHRRTAHHVRKITHSIIILEHILIWRSNDCEHVHQHQQIALYYEPHPAKGKYLFHFTICTFYSELVFVRRRFRTPLQHWLLRCPLIASGGKLLPSWSRRRLNAGGRNHSHHHPLRKHFVKYLKT